MEAQGYPFTWANINSMDMSVTIAVDELSTSNENILAGTIQEISMDSPYKGYYNYYFNKKRNKNYIFPVEIYNISNNAMPNYVNNHIKGIDLTRRNPVIRWLNGFEEPQKLVIQKEDILERVQLEGFFINIQCCYVNDMLIGYKADFVSTQEMPLSLLHSRDFNTSKDGKILEFNVPNAKQTNSKVGNFIPCITEIQLQNNTTYVAIDKVNYDGTTDTNLSFSVSQLPKNSKIILNSHLDTITIYDSGGNKVNNIYNTNNSGIQYLNKSYENRIGLTTDWNTFRVTGDCNVKFDYCFYINIL